MTANGSLTIKYNDVELQDYTELLIPEKTKITAVYSLSDISSDNNYYISITSGEKNVIYDINNENNDNISNAQMDILIPSLYSNTNNIVFSLIEQSIDSNNNNAVVTEVIGNTCSYSNYVYPFIIEKDAIRIERCNSNYEDNPYGEYLKIKKIKFSLPAGNISDITKIEIQINKSVQNSETKIIDITSHIGSLFSENGYLDNSSHIFSSLNDTGFFKETKFTYSFDFIFTYTIIGVSSGEPYAQVIKKYPISNIGLEQSFTSLQLVGKTKLTNGDIIYGGITIGQNPTIKTIGEPAFECGYPAYFNNAIYINNIKYGYYSGDTYEVYPGESIPGYITKDYKDLVVTFNLGQPIFAIDFDMSGNFIGRAYRELTSATVKSPLSVTDTSINVTKQIVNQKSGVIVVKFTKISGNWGSDQYNRAAVITSGTENLKLTFK